MYRTYDGHYIDYGDDDETEDWQAEYEYDETERRCSLCGKAFEASDDHDEDCPLYRAPDLPF